MSKPSPREQDRSSGETPRDPVHAMLADEQLDRKFLGREFLTWLVYHADDDNGAGAFTDPGDDAGGEIDEFSIQVGARVVLRAPGDDGGEITVRGQGQGAALSTDVRYAIAGGLTVREVDLAVARGDRVWQLALSADAFDLKRAKLPELLSEEDDDRALERLCLLEELDQMLQRSYQAFLHLRLQPRWESEQVPRIRTWLARSCLAQQPDRPATAQRS